MKLLRPITEADYERQLARLVAQFERDCTKVRERHSTSEDSMLARLYAAFCESPTPLTAREAAQQAGLPLTTAKEKRNYRVAVEQLEKGGWVKPAGLVERGWRRGRGGRSIMRRPVMTFKGVTERESKQPANFLVNTFIARVESLNQRRAISSCMAQRIESVARPMSERNQQIIAARLQGRILKDIGAEYQVTRERIRQIVSVSLQPKTPVQPKTPRVVRQPKPKPVNRQVASSEIRAALQSNMCADISRFSGISLSTIYRMRDGARANSSTLTKIENAMRQMGLVLSLPQIELPSDSWWLDSGIIA